MSMPFDEMYSAGGAVREHYSEFERW
ncbi:MAG: hypothetical protein H6R02_2972, partial [Burkholderiaceae bacterium]|nr:hypothetical protein [Burkholderiaceae bacterium]